MCGKRAVTMPTLWSTQDWQASLLALTPLSRYFDEGVDSVGQILHGVEEVEGHDRFHDVQFELAVFDARLMAMSLPMIW